jgi:RNA polymerase sigma-70 factor (ECF subfamily)
MRAWGGRLDESDDAFDVDDAHPVDVREMVVRHQRAMFGYARALTGNDADAEDLAQTAALRALESSTPLRDPQRAKWYLLKIVRNLAADNARRRGRIAIEPHADVPETATYDAHFDEFIVLVDDWEGPRAALAALSPVHRDVLHLRFVEDLDNAAIAARLHTTEHAARQRVYRALQALRAIVRDRDVAS